MTFVITEPCIDTTDQSCVSVCPVDCIHFEEGKDRILYINPTDCIDCGACQPACPVSAIFPEAEVPAASQRFTAINELWYADPAAARAQVGGEAAVPAPAAAAAAPSSAAPAAAAARPPAAPAAAAVPAAPQAAVAQVSAGHAPPAHQPLSPAGFVWFVLFAGVFVLMFVVPGPPVLHFGSVSIGLVMAALLPIDVILGVMFIASQVRELHGFAATHERRLGGWRSLRAEIRRNEESRRYLLAETVQQIARERFAFPNAEYPDLRTYVNLPEPTLALEPRGSGDKLFPDILTVSYPGNRPVAVVQVETRETVTRDQATNVWAQLENQDAPVYLYVPAGMLARAKDYAGSAGMKRVKFRTWRWTPNGMLVRED